ncbi:MAG: radical SAM protein [Thermodesulfobacteriota bacterium]|nr:radical SAM protein [Thermodesulfobacteriota bacterium]
MNFRDYAFDIFPKTIGYNFSRFTSVNPSNPITLTFSVTAACQSLCKTCQIGKMYRENPERTKDDLSLDEIEKIFQSIGHVYFFNVSGGEPFLRSDLPEIIQLALIHLSPRMVHIPTNAIATKRIKKSVLDILSIMAKRAPNVPLTIKPSIDGIGPIHDSIRGVKGNFDRLLNTINMLKLIEKEHPCFHLELGTVVSKFNINHLSEIEDFVHDLGVESYRNEIAEQRAEFFNIGDPITPGGDIYGQLMERFKKKIKKNLHKKKRLARITESFRLVYYDLVGDIMKKETQAIPCFGGISNAHLNYNGELWPCCVLGYKKPMGNLRQSGYDFQSIWNSEKSQQVRIYIKDKMCWCPLANQAYSNILCHPPSMLKVFGNLFHHM